MPLHAQCGHRALEAEAEWGLGECAASDENPNDEVVAPCLLSDELAVSFNAGADYSLDVATLAHDGDTLQECIDAVAVYRGELLPGFYGDWVILERERLEALVPLKMQRLLERLVEERRWAQVVEWGERWVTLGHAPEPAFRALM